MTSPVIRRSYRRSIPLFLSLLASLSLLSPAPTLAQPAASLKGVVVDQGGSAIAGARVTATGPDGSVVQTVTADANGNFTLTGLEPGSHSVQIEMHLFTPTTVIVVVPPSGSPAPLRAVMTAGGYAESIVVTARRVETRLAETPQKIEVIDAADIERSVAADLTDVLKKNAGVDVVQYSGALSGIGIRGFRPQFSGINKRSLLLIDGRPSGVTNLATFLLDDVERIEVLKGAASSVYGSSAMGGVVNIITRQSRGAIGGTAQIGVGSFGASEVAGRTGGNLSSQVDFDASGNAFDQRDDYRMGNGEVRPATTYKTYSGTVRVGADLGTAWRIDGRVNGYRGRDIMTPGDLFTGINSQGSKNLERSTEDARLTGRVGSHDVAVTAYGAAEAGHTSNETTTNPLDQPYLPYLSFENELRWVGVQVKDSWSWSRLNSIVAGVDYERVTSTSRSYARTGVETAPFSANSTKRTAGLYAENTVKLRNGRTVLAVGARIDRIITATVETPLKTNFVPSESRATVFNPSLGVKHEVIKGLRGHFTIGRAFVPAEASMLTGFTTTVVSGRTQITQGNPDLKAERSVSLDVGAEWTARSTRFDVTAFRTVVKNRFISNVVISNPLPPDPIVVSVANGLDAHISGLDLEAGHRVSARIGLFANATHYFRRKERLLSGSEQDILNVALNTVRGGIDWDLGRVSTRVSGRYVQGRKDNDFNAPGFPIVDYDNFTVIDASASYRIARQHSAVVALNNLCDAFYYEKLGYPLQGASFKLSYRLGF